MSTELMTEPVADDLAAAMCRVMRRVGYVQKDKAMTSGAAYRYVSVEAVIAALRPEMVEEGLVLLPTGIDPLHMGTHESKSGSVQNHCQVKYTFTLMHQGSGRSMPVVVLGEAMDTGDKTSNKVMTAARKYALIMAFNIETGLDPDDTPSASQEREQTLTAQQIAELDILMVQTGTDRSRFLRWAEAADMRGIPRSKFENAKRMLNAKQKVGAS